jgi:hypothetical protein
MPAVVEDAMPAVREVANLANTIVILADLGWEGVKRSENYTLTLIFYYIDVQHDISKLSTR